ncbi:MAG: hypothetical protein M3N41_11405 [Acidobacteriota bacterium]|nr:hypothetical protein [Acidobacteriota bacterium]
MTPSKLGIAFLVFATTAAAQTNNWELGHPDAKLLLGIDVKSIRQSAAWQIFSDQTKAQAPPAVAQPPLQATMQNMAQGIFSQIDRIFVSSPGNPALNAKTNAPFLLAIEGKLPLDALKPFMQSPAKRYRTADLYRTTKTDTTTLAVLDGLLLLGDEKSVLSALDRRGHGLLTPSKTLARAKALAATHDFWIVADESLSKFQTVKDTWNPLAMPFASQVKGMDFGLAVRDGLQFELSLATDSEAAASQMAQMVASQIQMELAAQPNSAEIAETVQKLKIDSLGNRMRVSLALTGDEFAAQLEAVQAARLRAAAAAPKTPPPAMRPAKTATPGKITIYGLDGGPRVIETTH